MVAPEDQDMAYIPKLRPNSVPPKHAGHLCCNRRLHDPVDSAEGTDCWSDGLGASELHWCQSASSNLTYMQEDTYLLASAGVRSGVPWLRFSEDTDATRSAVCSLVRLVERSVRSSVTQSTG